LCENRTLIRAATKKELLRITGLISGSDNKKMQYYPFYTFSLPTLMCVMKERTTESEGKFEMTAGDGLKNINEKNTKVTKVF
jgi:hypothetical protein